MAKYNRNRRRSKRGKSQGVPAREWLKNVGDPNIGYSTKMKGVKTK